jgi:prepilin-type N-terminal cleavage/methylation domain-containing protein
MTQQNTYQKNTDGFTIIELVVAVTIGSILLTVLYQGFAAIQKNYIASTARTNLVALQGPVIELITNDYASCCVLAEREKKETAKTATASQPDKNKKDPAQTTNPAQAANTDQKKKEDTKEKQQPPFLLFSDGKQTRLAIITTTNVFASYNNLQPLPQRVIYYRTPKNSLVRYASSDYTTKIESEKNALDFIAKQKLEPLTIFESITDWLVEAIVLGEEGKKGDKVTLTEWSAENKETKRIIPDGCVWHITLKLTTRPYELLFATPILTSEQKPLIQTQAEPAKAATSKKVDDKGKAKKPQGSP